MANNQANLRVTKEDFLNRIGIIETKMGALKDVVQRYNNAINNLDQFIESDDSNYEKMVERIKVNIEAASKSYAALSETKASLQATVEKMEGMSSKVGSTLDDARKAAEQTINTTIRLQVEGLL